MRVDDAARAFWPRGLTRPSEDYSGPLPPLSLSALRAIDVQVATLQKHLFASPVFVPIVPVIGQSEFAEFGQAQKRAASGLHDILGADASRQFFGQVTIGDSLENGLLLRIEIACDQRIAGAQPMSHSMPLRCFHREPTLLCSRWSNSKRTKAVKRTQCRGPRQTPVRKIDSYKD